MCPQEFTLGEVRDAFKGTGFEVPKDYFHFIHHWLNPSLYTADNEAWQDWDSLLRPLAHFAETARAMEDASGVSQLPQLKEFLLNSRDELIAEVQFPPAKTIDWTTMPSHSGSQAPSW